jgi:hypothetical protein
MSGGFWAKINSEKILPLWTGMRTMAGEIPSAQADWILSIAAEWS